MKLLILSSSTGGGHDMRANALKGWSLERNWEVLISHPLETTFKFYALGSNFYNLIQKKWPAFHNLYFYFLEIANLHRNKFSILGTRKWLEKLNKFQPNIIVSVHAHLNHGYLEILKENLNSSFKFIVYCGELGDSFGFSRHWINYKADCFMGPFEETCNAALKRGMPKDKIFEAGPLLRRAFYEVPTKLEKEKRLLKFGISSAQPYALLGTGANGVNQHLKVLSALKKQKGNLQVVALCGGNIEIFQKIELIKKSYPFNVVPLQTIDDRDMAILLKNAEFLFARPGAGTTTEAVACGTPMIFDVSGGIMPQERNNLNFWFGRSSAIVKLKNPSNIYKYLDKSLPKIDVNMEHLPSKILDYLENLSN